MISLENNVEFSYKYIGLFHTEDEWIHPTITIDTYELIYVTKGTVYITENNIDYTLTSGDSIILYQGIEHKGTKPSNGTVEFYWLHFHCKNYDNLNIPKLCKCNDFQIMSELKKIMHLSVMSTTRCELSTIQLLLSLPQNNSGKNKLAYEISEYIRINLHCKLTVNDIAKYFKYDGDYLSRVYKREFGSDLKTAINNQRIAYIDSILLNTNSSIKEIAECCGFNDDNSFIKYYKYHKKISPTIFRNQYYFVHMNNH